MRRQGQRLHIQRGKFHRDLAQRLHRIGMHDRAGTFCPFAHRRNILDHAGFVVGEHHRHQDRFFGQCRIDVGQIEDADAGHF